MATILSIVQECNASKVKRKALQPLHNINLGALSYTQALWTLMFGSLLCAVEKISPLVVAEA